MTSFILRRLVSGTLTIAVVATVVFFALRFLPGDPVEAWLGDYATPELIQITKEKWGLDRPVMEQYATYLKNLSRGDLGLSLRNRVPVTSLILRHYPFTVRLMLFCTLISVLIAIPVGISAAVRQNSFTDMLVMASSFLFISTPDFWFGLLVLFLFSFHLGWFPTMGGESGGDALSYLSYLALPSICLGLRHAGLLCRLVRSTMIDTLGRDYITVARSKGVSERRIYYKHALRNALSPIVSLIGVSLVLALAGAVIIEVVFSRPGLGRLYVSAIAARDYPLIQGCVLVIAIGVVLINMVVDLSYGLIDPRIRHE